MFSRAAVVAFVLVVAEYFAYLYGARLFGVSAMIVLTVVSAAVGLVVFRRSLGQLARAGHDLVSGGPMGVASAASSPSSKLAADHGVKAVAGLLLLVPGLVTSAAGLLLLVPPVRMVVKARLRARTDALLQRGFGFAGGAGSPFFWAGSAAQRRDVVDVDLHPDGTDPGDSVNEDIPPSARPELN